MNHPSPYADGNRLLAFSFRAEDYSISRATLSILPPENEGVKRFVFSQVTV
jgi:hypothetical protein